MQRVYLCRYVVVVYFIGYGSGAGVEGFQHHRRAAAVIIARAHDVEQLAVGCIVGRSKVECLHLFGFEVQQYRCRRHISIVACRIDKHVFACQRRVAVEVFLACFNILNESHRCRVNHAHGRFVAVLFLKTVSAAVAYIQFSLVNTDAFRLPSHLAGADNLMCTHINFGYKAFGKRFSCTLMGIRCNVKITAVGSHFAVVGHAFSSSAGRAVGVDELDNVRCVYANSQQGIVNLDDVVRRVAQFMAVYLPEPSVGKRARVAVVERKLAVILLPQAFVAKDKALFLWVRRLALSVKYRCRKHQCN